MQRTRTIHGHNENITHYILCRTFDDDDNGGKDVDTDYDSFDVTVGLKLLLNSL